jgi:mannose-6-phosphate isomerase-like protein (cupin superfamily)
VTEPWRGVHVPADDGELLVFNGTHRRLKVTARQTEGHLTAFVSAYPDGVSHPLHIHHDAIESFFIIEGAARFYVDGVVVDAEQGAFLSVPAGPSMGSFPPLREPERWSCSHRRPWRGFGRRSKGPHLMGRLMREYLQTLSRRHHVELLGPRPEEMLGP